MKKISALFITLILAAAVALGGCGGSANWTKPTLTDPGQLISAQGFVAETENYLYLINGAGTSTADNTFGAPVKGSLIAVEKSTIGTDNLNAQVVVPKLFVASDYGAGVFIHDGYVYYGSPSTDRNSEGGIANDELAFMRTKLDGSQDSPEIYFTAGALSTQYRITESGGTVYIIYYDSANTSVKVYNTSTRTETEVAKTDAQNNTPLEEGKELYGSLGTVSFADSGDTGSAALFYTVTVYNEKYYEDKASQDGYTRSTASYNMVYAVNAAGQADKVLDGEANSETYAITLIEGGYVFYTATPVSGTAKTYVKSVADMLNAQAAATEVKNTDYVTSGVIVNGLKEVYYWDSEAQKVIKSTFTGSEAEVKETVLMSESVSTLLFVNDGYIYYLNSSSQLARALLSDEDAKEQRISQDTVGTATSWYLPQLITVGDKDYVFYLDTSTAGSSYVWYTDLSSEVIGEDTDDDDEDDLFYMEGQQPAAVMLDEDRANVAVAAINDIEGELEWEMTDGKFTVASVEKANEIYNALPQEIKDLVGDTYTEKLENCNRAIELGDKYYKLKGVANYEKLSEEEQQAYRTAYDEAKAYRQALIDEIGEDGYVTVRNMLDTQIKSYYSSAYEIFEAEEE